MNPPGACWDSCDEDDLPQMDGTCDACEPDEPQPATQMCALCRFAFCPVHADKHTRSTRHQLQPYCPTEQPLQLAQRVDGHGQAEVADNGLEGAEAAGGGGRDPEEEEQQCGSEAGKRDTVTVERLRCKEHGQEGSLYCKQDEKIVCVVCAVQGEHREHEIITLREAYMWQKSKEGIDLLACTQEMSEKIKTKWTSPDMSPDELERYVNQQFDELHRLVRLEEWRVLHLVDLKEAFLTAQAAEKIAEISVHTERLQEEMDSITQQLGELDQAERNGVAPAALAPLLAAQPQPPRAPPEPRPQMDPEARPRPDHRRGPEDPRDYGDEGDSFMGHAP
ncbi:tripartite motif-containing protein 44 [Colossoma macropomum]|uniref:tripartite motif-containing protein 44 n=1 Tax=Colossoma macropomum TaxID=42526 RepID=UPI00186427B7|nr:tripartite motif-containing protein 44 [Colossoma macropomum]